MATPAPRRTPPPVPTGDASGTPPTDEKSWNEEGFALSRRAGQEHGAADSDESASVRAKRDLQYSRMTDEEAKKNLLDFEAKRRDEAIRRRDADMAEKGQTREAWEKGKEAESARYRQAAEEKRERARDLTRQAAGKHRAAHRISAGKAPSEDVFGFDEGIGLGGSFSSGRGTKGPEGSAPLWSRIQAAERGRRAAAPSPSWNSFTMNSGTAKKGRQEEGSGEEDDAEQDKRASALARHVRFASQLDARRRGGAGESGATSAPPSGGGLMSQLRQGVSGADGGTQGVAALGLGAATSNFGRGLVKGLWSALWPSFGHTIYLLILVFLIAKFSKDARKILPQVGEEWIPPQLLKAGGGTALTAIRTAELLAIGVILILVLMLDIAILGIISLLLGLITSAAGAL